MSMVLCERKDIVAIADKIRAANGTTEEMTMAEIVENCGGGASGGVELNIAYGDTAPEDTSKLWVKTSEPSDILISPQFNGKENLTVLEAELFKKLTTIEVGAVGTKIYLFGGLDDNSDCLRTIQAFDTETETIETLTTTLPVPLFGTVVGVVGTKIYLFGGYDNNANYLNTIQVFDTETETIETLTTMPVKLRYIATGVVGSKIYLFGGNGIASSNKIFKFDTETGLLTTLTTVLQTKISRMTSGAVGTKIYLFGGYDESNSEYLNTIQVFDTETETIETLTITMPVALINASCSVVGTKIYVFGGYAKSNSNYLNTIQVFDTETETIETLTTTLPYTLGYSGMGTVNDTGYLFGGYIDGNPGKSILKCKMDLELNSGTVQILTDMSSNMFPLLQGNTMLKTGVKKVYKGNSNNVGEPVETYLYKDGSWNAI